MCIECGSLVGRRQHIVGRFDESRPRKSPAREFERARRQAPNSQLQLSYGYAPHAGRRYSTLYTVRYALQVTADCSSGVPLPLPGTPSRITPSRRCTFRALPLETIHNRTHMTHRHAYNRMTHTQEQMHPPPSMQPCHACCCSSPAHSSAAASSRVTRGVALGTLRAGCE